MYKTIKKNHSEVCAVIIEPLIQCAGYMRMYHHRYLELLSEACRKFKIHLKTTYDIIFNYFGLVIPLGLFKYDWGIIYGNGEFGKFIFKVILIDQNRIEKVKVVS